MPNPRPEATRVKEGNELQASQSRAPHPQRVCQAWHRASRVKSPMPGIGGAEGYEKGKGIIVRWGLKEATGKPTTQRTGSRRHGLRRK